MSSIGIVFPGVVISLSEQALAAVSDRRPDQQFKIYGVESWCADAVSRMLSPLVPPCVAGGDRAARIVRRRAGDANCICVLQRLCHGALQRAICCHSASRHRPNPDPSAQRYSIDFRSECKDPARVHRQGDTTSLLIRNTAIPGAGSRACGSQALNRVTAPRRFLSPGPDASAPRQ